MEDASKPKATSEYSERGEDIVVESEKARKRESE
jgi:hypothetical protein